MQRRDNWLQKREEPLRYVTEYKGQIIGKDEYIPAESRETSINFAEGSKYFVVHSHTQAIMEGLLKCPAFEIIAIELALIKGDKKHPNKARAEKVVGVKGRLPIGMLSVKSRRADDEIFRIISPRICTLSTAKLVAPSRPRRGETGNKSTQIGKPYKITTSKKRRRTKRAESAWRRWVYGGERDPLLEGHSL